LEAVKKRLQKLQKLALGMGDFFFVSLCLIRVSNTWAACGPRGRFVRPAMLFAKKTKASKFKALSALTFEVLVKNLATHY